MDDIDAMYRRFPEMEESAPEGNKVQAVHDAASLVLGFYHVKYRTQLPNEVIREVEVSSSESS